MNRPINFNDPTGHWVETALDVAFIAYDIYDISQNGLNWENGLALTADIVCAALPVVAGGGLAVRAIAHADDAAKAISHVDDAIKVVDKADEIVDVVKKAPIVIGENMKKVEDYANRIGANYYKPRKIDPYIPSVHDPISQARNKRWIEDMMRQGREIIDIGPDFTRRKTKGPSKWYEIERTAIAKRDYFNYKKKFVR